jgi:hypothetical protein
MKQAALERGASLGSIFLIPSPRPGEDDSRTLVQLGKKYGEAYRHAAGNRRKPAGQGPGVAILQPLANCA